MVRRGPGEGQGDWIGSGELNRARARPSIGPGPGEPPLQELTSPPTGPGVAIIVCALKYGSLSQAHLFGHRLKSSKFEAIFNTIFFRFGF